MDRTGWASAARHDVPATPMDDCDADAPVSDVASTLEWMTDGHCLALALAHRRPLAVSVLALEPLAADSLRLAVHLSGGPRAHGLALEARHLTLNLLDADRLHLHRRFGGVGPAAGWDEVLGVPVRYRGSRPPLLDGAPAWLEIRTEPGQEETPERLLAVVADGWAPHGRGPRRAPAPSPMTPLVPHTPHARSADGRRRGDERVRPALRATAATWGQWGVDPR